MGSQQSAMPADEVESSYRYLSGYVAPRPMAEQVGVLRTHFPKLPHSWGNFGEGAISPLAEGCFAIPRWQMLAPVYNEALALVLEKLEHTRNGVWFNNRAGQLDAEGLRQRPDYLAALNSLAAGQGDPAILCVPAQFALRHRGRSVERVRQCYGEGEFGLGAFDIAIMMLTHPERLQQEHDLFVDAPGDEFDDRASDIRFGRTPCLCFEQERLEFGTHWTSRAYDYNGSATGFLPISPQRPAAARRSRVSDGQYLDEELDVPLAYPTSYRQPKALDEQMALLGAVLPGIGGYSLQAAAAPLPENAEGYFAVPRWETVADTYNEALEIMLDRLAAARGGRFHNFRRGRLGPEVLRQHGRTAAALADLSAAQGHPDVLVIAAQFGLRHLGRSVRRARTLFEDGEFGLGGFHVAAMVLTHPERLANPDWRRQRISAGGLECPGDEYDDAVRRQGRSPCLFFDGGEEEFGTHWIHRAEATSGSVSAFRK
jgi:hypothetical protein